jgi:hypothetical protein
MVFPDLSMGQYITRQYTQNVANALSSVTDVPTASISTLDVRPSTGSSGKRRALLQSSGNGVQVRMADMYSVVRPVYVYSWFAGRSYMCAPLRAAVVSVGRHCCSPLATARR